MQDIPPATVIDRYRLLAHLLVPAALGLVLMGLYFSGSATLQGIVAPTVEGLHPFSWREFGALEMLQNVVLLAIIALLADNARRAGPALLRMAFAIGAAMFAFVLLEEVDYGRHWYEWLTGDIGPLDAESWNRNLHNRVAGTGEQYSTYMRFSASVFVGLAFVLAPLFLQRSRHEWVRMLLPSRWMIATVVLMVLLSDLAHALDDAGRAVIGGVPGNLERNISEFRELILYYLFGLYGLELNLRLRRSRRAPTGAYSSRRHGANVHDEDDGDPRTVPAGSPGPGQAER